MLKKLIFIALIFKILPLKSQDTSYARQIINTLASDDFKGRGYVNNGDKIAAKWIANEFKKLQLLPANKGSYFQNFKFPNNTFPKTVELTINGIVLKPGVDYIINPDCPSVNFDGEIQFFDANELNSENHYDKKGYPLNQVILDTFNSKYFEEASINQLKYQKDFKKNIIIQLTNNKLTWSSSYQVSKKCLITLKSSALKRNSVYQVKIKIKNKFNSNYTSQNVLGYIEGYSSQKDSFIVFTAHYDHLGMLGKKAVFNGANDNASGVAMMLDLAKYYSKNKPKYNMLFIAFSGEETGLIGSQYYVMNPIFPLSGIKFLINIDLMGNGSEGVMAVNGSLHQNEFNLLKSINDSKQYLPSVKSRGKAANSDHYFFSEAGVKCFFFYLMGPYPFYHDVDDRPEMVPLSNYLPAFYLFRDFINQL